MPPTACADWEISGADLDSLPVSGQFGEIVGDTQYFADDDGDLYERRTSLAEFAEIAGADEAVSRSVAATKRVITQASAERRPPPPMRVVAIDEADEDDVRSAAIADAFEEIVVLGDDSGRETFPTLRRLYESFRGGGSPKYVRLDTEDSYRDFRRDQSAEMAALKQKVAELNLLLHRHIADGHGAQDRIEGIVEIDPRVANIVGDISMLRDAADPATKRVPLMLPPWAEGKIDCWREGDAICCSIRLPGPDGEARICTSATPIARHVEKACGYVARSGVDPVDMLGVLPTLVCMLGAETIPMMAKAAPAILSRPEVARGVPFVGRMVPATDPSMASLIALLHLCQHGDVQACSELNRMKQAASAPGGAPLAGALNEAAQRLAKAQGKNA